MLKNMTRKGLAVGAGLAFVASSIVSIPASANTADIVLKPAAGSATNFVGTQAITATTGGFYLDLNTGLTGATGIGGNTQAASLAKYLVEIVNTDVTFADIYDDNDLSTIPSTTVAQNDIMFYTGGVGTTNTAPVAVGGGAVSSTARSFVVDGANTVSQNLHVVAAYTDAVASTVVDTLTLKITPFLDLDNDDRNDDGKFGASVSVDLVSDAGVSFTPVFDYVQLGATAVTGKFTTNVNLGVYRLVSGDESSVEGTQELGVTLTSDVAGATTESTQLTYDFNAALGAKQFNIPADADLSDEVVSITIRDASASNIKVGQVASINGAGTFTDTTGGGAINLKGDLAVVKTVTSAGGTTTVALDYVGSNAALAGAVQTAGVLTLSINTLTYDSTNEEYDFSFGADQVDAAAGTAPTAVAAGKFTATVQYNGATATIADATSTTVGTGAKWKRNATSNVALTVVAGTVDNIEIKAATSATVAQDTTLTGAATVVALEETKSLTFTVQAWTNAGKTIAAGAGLPVQVTLRDDANGLDTTTISSNSKSLTAAGVNTTSFSLNTDANGQITFTVAADKAVDGEYFHIDVTLESKTDTTIVKWQEETVSLIQTPDSNFKIAPKGSVSVDYTVVNQFGRAVANDTYQLLFTRAATADSTGRDTTAEYASWSYIAPVASGRSSVTIVDNGADAKGLDTVTATLQKKATNGGYASTSTTDTFTISYDTAYKTPSLTAVVSNNGVAIGTTSVYPVALEAKTLSSIDTRAGGKDPKYADVNAFDNKTDTTADNLLKISGKVLSSANAGLASVAVKISAKGLNFANASTSAASTIFANDSIVVVTNATGDYEAWVRSAVGGKQTITVEAAGLSKTADVTFAIGTASVGSFEVKVPTTALPGTTADVVVTAKDKAGNAAQGVSVTLSSTGPGYLINTSGTTLSDGTFSTKLLVGSNDSGVATVKVTMTVDGVETSKTATVNVGAPEANAVIGSFNGRVAVRVENAKGSTISVKIGKSWYKYTATNANYLKSWKSTKGSTQVVTVYVDGDLQNTATITVK
jgi:hypothetical protein